MVQAAADAPREAGRTDGGGVRAVSRALAILDAFDREGTVYSLAALARRVDLPRTTTLRMVESLVREGMLLIGDDGSVGVGTRLIRWGALASAAWAVPAATTEVLRDLSDRTGETASIYIRDGLRRTVVAQAQSRHTLRHVVQTGDELPLWGGAAAMVLIGLEREPARVALIDEIVRDADGRTTVAALSAAVDRAVRDGYAVSHGGREIGNSGIAIAVPEDASHARRARVPVGLALGGPTVRFTDDRVAAFLDGLRTAAAAVASTGLPAAVY